MKFERLTERRETPLTMSMWGGSSRDLKVYNRLAKLEDEIEQGTLIELPCKEGDTVWEVSPFSKMPTALTAPNIYTILRWKEDEVFGRELFLTREEAEKRLKEMQE